MTFDDAISKFQYMELQYYQNHVQITTQPSVEDPALVRTTPVMLFWNSLTRCYVVAVCRSHIIRSSSSTTATSCLARCTRVHRTSWTLRIKWHRRVCTLPQSTPSSLSSDTEAALFRVNIHVQGGQSATTLKNSSFRPTGQSGSTRKTTIQSWAPSLPATTWFSALMCSPFIRSPPTRAR